MSCDEVYDVVGLQNFDQENGYDMTWVVVKSFVVFLSLENVDQVSTLQRNTRDVRNFILSLLLMVWRVRNFEFLLISLIVDLHETKFWKAVLVSDTVESNASNLDPHGRLSRPPGIDILEILLFDDELFHGLLHVSHPLRGLLLPQFRNFEGPKYSCYWYSEGVKCHELAMMAIELLLNSDLGLPHSSVLLLAVGVNVPFASMALHQLLTLLLLSSSVELRVVGITEAVDWRLSCQLIIVKNARIVLRVMNGINLDAVMHIFENIIVKWDIWLADRGHLRWNDV